MPTKLVELSRLTCLLAVCAPGLAGCATNGQEQHPMPPRPRIEGVDHIPARSTLVVVLCHASAQEVLQRCENYWMAKSPLYSALHDRRSCVMPTFKRGLYDEIDRLPSFSADPNSNSVEIRSSDAGVIRDMAAWIKDLDQPESEPR